MRKGLVLSLAVSLLVGKALALSWNEGWQLVAKAQEGDRGAVRSLIAAYEGGDPEAAVALGTLYLHGLAYPQDFRKAWEYFSWARGKGSGWASAMLAIIYGNGLGVQVDPKQATALAEESARRDYPGGQALSGFGVILGWKGKATDEEIGQAVAMVVRAGATGEPIALNTLARLHFAGSFERYGVPKDWAKAVRLWEESYAKGYVLAAMRLIPSYYYGYGVPADPAKAVALAERLYTFAPLLSPMFGSYLATALYFGVGGKEKNPARACAMAERSRQDVQGMALYGLCILENHLQGSKATGYAWILKSAGAGNDLGKALAEEWEKKLSKADVDEAKRLLPDLK